ncbi:class F sortase [Microtetraspora malaysiensis]|uniref:class F sortase n=1 Tax=Microtetraspora malaysiensis TaxID=161358 RepID=UPI003D8FB6A9
MNSTPDAHDDTPQADGDGAQTRAAQPDPAAGSGATGPTPAQGQEAAGPAVSAQAGTPAGPVGSGETAPAPTAAPTPVTVSAPGAAPVPAVAPVPGVAPAPAAAPAPKARKSLPQPVLATLLVGGSFGGIAAIMAGLLAVLSPTQEEVETTRPVPGEVVALQGAGTFLPPTVGPGGPGTKLTAAAPTAPPPLPALQPLPPLTITTTTTSSSSSSSSSKTGRTASARPIRIRIPSIGVNAALGSVGVLKSGEIQSPSLSRPKIAAWYRLGPTPGELGPAVILGHVNTRTGAAVFSRLRELQRGNKIEVRRADGKSAIFTVDGVEQVGKTTFPTNRVYGNIATSGLRLITCGGVYNAKNHSYTDNIVVYATMTGTRNAK